jgi:hypothetical protein
MYINAGAARFRIKCDHVVRFLFQVVWGGLVGRVDVDQSACSIALNSSKSLSKYWPSLATPRDHLWISTKCAHSSGRDSLSPSVGKS